MYNTRHKIVLVDDNLATLDQGKSLLQAFYKVYTVQTAATLFENLELDIPDLILLDVEMPEMDGFEAIEKLKADPRYKDIPVIFLTSKSDEESERKGFSLGAVDYITKPFSGPLLQKRISNQILYMRVQNAVKDYSNDLEIMVGELAKANERTKILMEKTPFCARLWNNKYELIDCNEAAINLFGFKDKEECLMMGYSLYPEYQPDGTNSVEKIKEYHKQTFDGGACEFDWIYRMPDGTDMPAVVILVRVEYDDGFAVAEYTRDMREHYNAMNRILEDEERMRIMLDSMPFACRLFDKNFNFIDCNQEALNLVGAKNKEEYREKADKILPEFQPCGKRSLDLRMEYLDKAFNDGYVRFEWDYQTLEGVRFPCEVTMVRVVSKGEFIVAGYARDLREQKAVIEEMRRAEIAEESNKAKSRFLANMSHEIRTPMNSIVGFSELALDDEISPKTEKYLRNILENAQGLLHIINDILDISKIESGKMEIESVPFDPHELFAACQSIILPRAIDKDLKLYIYAERPPGRKPLGDPTRLRQILINLLSNAVKFTKEGMVRLHASIVGTTDRTITVFIEVKDTGIGMSQQQMDRIFTHFAQAESGTTRKYGGTGLGLAISKNLVELMGGELCVESEPGVGSTFSFQLTFDTIDISDKEMIDEQSVQGELQKPTFEGEILLCEDNTMNQQVICEHLSRIGLKAVVADNGRIGLEMVKNRMQSGEKQFNLIFMDMHMPEMDGLEAASKIRELNLDIPIVAMTANIMSSDKELYEMSGMNGYVGKPFTSQELWKCLTKHFEPVSWQSDDSFQLENRDNELRKKLIKKFIESNSNKYKEITEALDSGDIVLAHRLVHTLKSNAGQLRKTPLQEVVADVEKKLIDGANKVTKKQLKALDSELNAVLEELAILVDKPK